jgi:DNA-directed RNA polymerase specialized sigma subunit, sigma24 homolog
VAVSKTELYQPKSRHSKGKPEAKLIGLITKGDEAAFNVFHSATNGLLFAILLHILGHTQTAEEVLSEIYDEIRRRSVWLSRRNERPLIWLILIAHRRAVERLCRQLNTKGALQGGKGNTVVDFINITEQRRQIRAALQSIPRLQRRMVELAFFSGMSNSEIATELGQPCDVVDDGLRSGMSPFFCRLKSLRFSPEEPIRRDRPTVIRPGSRSTSRYV